jgi:hypothetical protein
VRATPSLVAAAVACLAVSTATAAQALSRTITAISGHALPATIGKNVLDVSWSGSDTLLVATDQGVYGVAVAGGIPRELIKGVSLPDGLPQPTSLSSDGKWVSAISAVSNGGFALRLADQKRLLAQHSIRLIPTDVAVRGSRSCVLGYAPAPPMEAQQDVAAWCGGSSDSWAELKPLHHLHSKHAQDLFRSAIWPFGGRIVIEADGTVDVITSVQPGVFRYGADGKLREVLGQSTDDLVLEAMKEISTKFASDMENRYRLLLNAQPIIDDLVVTPTGPAILVRLADESKIHWELWYPLQSGGVGDRVRLGIERIGPYGHLRCDARGSDMACVGSMPPRNEASVAKTAQAWPHLWLFKLAPSHPPSKQRSAR